VRIDASISRVSAHEHKLQPLVPDTASAVAMCVAWSASATSVGTASARRGGGQSSSASPPTFAGAPSAYPNHPNAECTRSRMRKTAARSGMQTAGEPRRSSPIGSSDRLPRSG
jgi:hypothetical protein